MHARRESDYPIIVSSTKNSTIVKTKEVDYQQMSTEAIEDMLTDYRNELAGVEQRREWLSGEIGELQTILDDRAQEACETEEE